MTTATMTNRINGHDFKAKPKRNPRRKKVKADEVLFLSAAVTPWALAILLLMVSMPHLATGFQNICHCGTFAGWLLAIAIDSAQITAKLQLTVAKNCDLPTPAQRTSMAIIVATAVMSMTLNVLAFLEGATDLTGTVLAWVAGIMLPLLILALSYTGSCFALTKKRTSARRKR